MLSKSQIDRLGQRLRNDQHSESDLELLDAFRSSFGQAQETVVRTLVKLGLNPSGRIAKTTPSIVAKLKRAKGRLTRIQDIGGGRIVVENIAEQDHVVELIAGAFLGSKIVDRRKVPSYGYRAVGHHRREALARPLATRASRPYQVGDLERYNRAILELKNKGQT